MEKKTMNQVEKMGVVRTPGAGEDEQVFLSELGRALGLADAPLDSPEPEDQPQERLRPRAAPDLRVTKQLIDQALADTRVEPGGPDDAVREASAPSRPEGFPVFDCATTPLSRTMFIEASAGTGKTFALERLVLRFLVEEGVPVEAFLIVTFTKAATGELKERIRRILKKSQGALMAARRAGEEDEELQPQFSDETLARLWAGWREKGVAGKALFRITTALEDFDRCSIFTIHSFCQKMLQAWAFSSGAAFESEVGGDEQIVADAIDAFKRRWLESSRLSGWQDDQKRLMKLDCRVLLTGLLLHPGAADSLELPDAGRLEEALRDFVRTVPQEIGSAKRRAGVMSYDDMLSRMARSVAESPEFRRNVSEQYQAVLVDEFQDTDFLQYEIFRRLFLENMAPGFKGAVFVGDPKQSIYRFRGAEMDVYLKAREDVKGRFDGTIRTLATNYRSTPPVVDAVNALFTAPGGGSRFGKSIDCPRVESGADRYPLFRRNPETGALEPLPGFELWTQPWDPGRRAGCLDGWGDGKLLSTEARREAEARLVADEIAGLLASETYVGARLADPRFSLEEARLQPGDVAVLVRKHERSEALEKALSERGVGWRHTKPDDVFCSSEAQDILAVMLALDGLDRRQAVNAARATPVVGRGLKEIAITGDPLRDKAVNDLYLSDLQVFREAADRCRKLGPAAAIEHLFTAFDTVGRTLRRKGGERMLVNWLHVSELLNAAGERLKTLPMLCRWFEDELARAAESSHEAADERTLRVESDESLVRIETVFAAKGLEYPLVYAVGAGDPPDSYKTRAVFVRREAEAPGAPDGKRFAFYGELNSKTPEGRQDKEAQASEQIRIAYVWATRASARLVVPMLPGYRKASGVYRPANTGSIWVKLASGAGWSKTADLSAEGLVSQINEGLDEFNGRLKSESSFAGDKGKRLEMAACLEKAAESGEAARRDALLSAASALRKLPAGEALAGIRWIREDEISSRAAPVMGPGVKPGDRVAGVLKAAAVPSAWRSSSYSSITRGFDVLAASSDESRDPDESYDGGGPDAAPAGDRDFREDPAFLVGGKDTGDAVHNILEACIRSGLHGNREFLEDGEDGLSLFESAFDRAPGSRLLFRKARRAQDDLSQAVDEACRAEVLAWVRDRVQGVFETNWLGESGELRLSKSPAGCAAPELAFSMRVRTGLEPAEFARRILQANERLPEADRLPMADIRAETGRHPLKGFLEGRIDLLFQADDGRFWLADWKTDQPGAQGRRSYGQAAMRETMMKEKYGWQALFYLVALMRLLRDAYGLSPEAAMDRIGGMAYVFVRGFSHAFPAKEPAAVLLKPAAQLVLEADRLLDAK